MKKLSIDEIKKIELDMLIDIARFCEENNIDYFLSCGTLLGAIRHNGFIPWDDDIDITMPRKSYEKFIKTYKSNNNLKVVSQYNSKRYSRTYARVINMNTTRFNKKTSSFDMRVCVDIFPIDNFISFEHAKEVYSHISTMKKNVNRVNKKSNSLKNFIKKTYVFSFVFYLLANHNARKRDIYVKNNSLENGKYLSSLLFPTTKMPEVFNYSKIFPTKKEGIFSGHKFRIPNDSDYYLKCLYNDYMTLPKVEEQVPSHYGDVYLID